MRTCRNSPLRVLTRASRPGAVVPRVRLTSQRRKARRSSAWTCGSSVAGVAARRSVSIPSMRWSSAEQTTRFVARSHSQLPTRAMRWARFRCRATRRLPRPASWAALRAAFNSSTRSSVRACNRSRRSARSCEGSDAAGKVGPSSGAPDSNWRMAPRSRRRSRACECMSHPTAALGTHHGPQRVGRGGQPTEVEDHQQRDLEDRDQGRRPYRETAHGQGSRRARGSGDRGIVRWCWYRQHDCGPCRSLACARRPQATADPAGTARAHAATGVMPHRERMQWACHRRGSSPSRTLARPGEGSGDRAPEAGAAAIRAAFPLPAGRPRPGRAPRRARRRAATGSRR